MSIVSNNTKYKLGVADAPCFDISAKINPINRNLTVVVNDPHVASQTLAVSYVTSPAGGSNSGTISVDSAGKGSLNFNILANEVKTVTITAVAPSGCAACPSKISILTVDVVADAKKYKVMPIEGALTSGQTAIHASIGDDYAFTSLSVASSSLGVLVKRQEAADYTVVTNAANSSDAGLVTMGAAITNQTSYKLLVAYPV